MSSDAGHGHGNKGVEIAKAVFAVLGAVGIGLVLAGFGLGYFADGTSGFINKNGMAIRMNTTFALILLAISAGVVVGLAFLAAKKAGE